MDLMYKNNSTDFSNSSRKSTCPLLFVFTKYKLSVFFYIMQRNYTTKFYEYNIKTSLAPELE